MIRGINESSTKHISCKCNCRFDGRNCNSGHWWNNDKCLCDCEKHYVCEKDYVWCSATFHCAYLASIIDDSVITCNEIIE